jgi:hypothetical protein
MSRTFTAPASAMTRSSTASTLPLSAAFQISSTPPPATRPLASACKNQPHHQRPKQQLQPRAIGQAGKGCTWCVRRCGGANLDACYGGLQQARIRFKFSRSKRVQNNDARYKAAAHAAARRSLPHPNFFPTGTRHPVNGALSKTVEQDTVYELRQQGASSHEAHGDVSHIAAVNAVCVSSSNALTRV